MKCILKRAILMVALALTAGGAWGNNIQVTNVTVVGRDSNTAYVEFDLSWDNSWRYTNINHDAAWVFFKVQEQGETDWQHVILEGTGINPANYDTGTGTGIEFIVPSDRVGLFVRRTTEGAGTVSVQDMQAVWNFTSNGLQETAHVRVQAMAIEMVYVAEGSYSLGSGGTGIGELYEGGGGTDPFLVTNAGPIECGDEAGKLWGARPSGEGSMGGAGTISSNFPNGYAAFYCMKYEISQGQYADFLNLLTSAQCGQAQRYPNQNGRNRHTINGTASVPGSFSASAPDRACNLISWADGAAFADWAGLRPMTELEYEKACRGPLAPVADEYAWGTTAISNTTAIVNDGTGNDTATGGNCNYGACSPDGPYRCGIYATATSTREQAGASYWGIMELSGSVWEKTVTIGNAAGRAFTGLHGDGELAANGDANVTAWPGSNASGAGFRGGGWDWSVSFFTSDRWFAAYVNANRGDNYDGGWRAARSTPTGVEP